MNNLREGFFLSILALSCKNSVPSYDEKFGRLEGLDVSDDILVSLESFIPATVELPTNFAPIKIQNLTPWKISKKNFTLNNFKISEYKDFEYRGLEDQFYSYYINGEGKHLLVSQYLGLVISCSKKGEFLVPKNVYFSLRHGGFARMEIEYFEDQTKFIYKDSCVVVNNNQARQNPFDLNASVMST